jgi:hypothetical protein
MPCNPSDATKHRAANANDILAIGCPLSVKQRVESLLQMTSESTGHLHYQLRKKLVPLDSPVIANNLAHFLEQHNQASQSS